MVAAGYAPPVRRPIPVMGEAGQGMIDAELYNMHSAQFVSEHDAFLASRIAFVLSGGQVRTSARVDEDVLLTLERQAFIDFLKQEKTVARIDHMLKTGKPLRN
jgi:3-hydroxyacyl-CoA dehydrogenase